MLRRLQRVRWIGIPALLLLSGCASRESVKDIQLENGLRVVFTRAQSPIISAVFLTDYGDADGPSGLARMTNLSLLKGNAIRNSAGGLMFIETGLTSSVIGVQSPSANFEDCFQILCECMSQSTFDSTQLARTDANSWGLDLEKKSGLLMKKQVWKDQDVRAWLYPKSPLGRILSSSAPRYTRDQVVEFAKNHLRPERMVLSVAGSSPRRQILNTVRNTWSVRQKRSETAAFDTSASGSAPRPESAQKRGGSREMATFAVKGMRAYTDAFLGEYLAMTSLAVEKEREFVSTLSAMGIQNAEPLQYAQYEDDYTYLVMQASVPRGDGDRTLEIMKREMEETSRTGVSTAAFQTAKRRLESALAIQSQYTIQKAFFGAQAVQLDSPYPTLSSLQSRVEKITLNEVNRSFLKLLHRSRTWVAPVGNP
jgi:predicted Zn-dependent peptidase